MVQVREHKMEELKEFAEKIRLAKANTHNRNNTLKDLTAKLREMLSEDLPKESN